MSTIPLVVAVPLMLLMVCSVTWIAAETLRRSNARGTRGRFVWASVERATRYPAIAYLLISATINATVHRDWLMFCIDGMGVGLQLALLWEKRRDGEDDDFWTSFGQRMSDFLSRRTPVPSTA